MYIEASCDRATIQYTVINTVTEPLYREKYSGDKVLSGAHIGVCVSVTIQTAVLVETLALLGATVRLCSCNPDTTQVGGRTTNRKRGLKGQ